MRLGAADDADSDGGSRDAAAATDVELHGLLSARSTPTASPMTSPMASPLSSPASSPPCSPGRTGRSGARRGTGLSWRIQCGLVALSLLAAGRWVVAPLVLSDTTRQVNGNGDVSDRGGTVAWRRPRTSSDGPARGRPIRGANGADASYDERLGLACPAAAATDSGAAAGSAIDGEEPPPAAPWYDGADIARNASAFLRLFQQVEELDSGGHSYEDVYRGLYEFKLRYFVPHLARGMTLYESACGPGLRLLATLEVLERHGVRGVRAYGSDPRPAAVRAARQLLGAGLPADSATELGLVCQADPTRLRHVPASSMDFVFTADIRPLLDPLRLGAAHAEDALSRYTELCEASNEGDMEKYELAEEAQHAQNAWYRAWVEELLRIAKPGAPVVVEHVSQPLCVAPYDRGGVPQSFWKSNVEYHGWDNLIDPDSVAFEEDAVFRDRYHVFMRKKP